MTLGQLFECVKHGEKYMEHEATVKALKESYDSDYDLFYASKRIKKLTEGVEFTESEERNLNKIIANIEIIEGKVEDGKTLSEAYKNQKAAAIADQLNFLIEEVNNPSKKSVIPAEKKLALAKITASTKYFTENYISDKVVYKKITNPLFDSMIKEETKNLNEIL